MLNAELSAADRDCLDEFVQLRHSLAADLDMPAREEDALVHYQSNEVEELSTHELLIAEVSVFFDFTAQRIQRVRDFLTGCVLSTVVLLERCRRTR